MKLLLASIHIEPSPRAVPLGPAMLAAMLDRELRDQLETVLMDLYLQQSAAECAAQILACSPQVVGFSTYIWNRTEVLAIAACIKQSDPAVVVFAGGPEATTDPHGMLDSPALDFVLSGEAYA